MAALHLSSILNINSVIWISSLSDSEKGSTERVIDDLQPYFVSIRLPFQFVEPKTKAELLAGLDAVERCARAGLKPIIHFDTHGNADSGIYITASGEFVSWQQLVDKLRRINVATQNNLGVVSAACFGMHVIKPINVGEATPFFALVAPEKTVSFGYIEQHATRFYQDLFDNGDLVAAYNRNFSKHLNLVHCEKLLAIALVRYITAHCMGRGKKKRQEALMTQVFENGPLQNTRQNRRMVRSKMKRMIKPTQALIDRYVQQFLVGKTAAFSIQEIMNLARSSKQPLSQKR
jgi:hypothetical protein